MSFNIYMNSGEFKVSFGGDTAVGKSSIAKRFVKDDFDDFNESTIGAAYFNKKVDIDDKEVSLGIWDTAGQERYHALIPMYFRNAQAIILVYDVTSYTSFLSLKNRWLNEVRYCIDHDNIAVLENKSDLNNLRKVDEEEVKTFVEENDLLFFRTSAKIDDGSIEKCFKELYKNRPPVVENYKTCEINVSSKKKNRKTCCSS